MCLAKNREAARVKAMIAKLQLDVHRLNNVINPIPQPILADHVEDPSEEDKG
jgi:hypothetical protein